MAARKPPSPATAVTARTRSEQDRALIAAAFICDLVAVRELLASGANPNVRDDDGRTPLTSAVLGGSIALAGLLLESGADANARDHHGFSALHFAAQEDLPEMTRLLVSQGADANAQDEDGTSVLWRAVFSSRGSHDVAKALLAAGAKPDLPNKAGESARALAVRLGSNAFTTN